MNRPEKIAVAGITISLALGALLAWLGDEGAGVFALCGLVGFIINYVVFVPSYRARTETYYDITGTLCYVTMITLALVLSDGLDLRAVVVAIMMLVWALRLGSFLFRRVRADGGDGRFDRIKTRPLTFLQAWSLQGLWVFLTTACGLAIITSEQRESFGAFAVVGLIVWAVGFGIEVVADQQKRAFRANPENEGRFISTGLWAWSRHPNYFGEIMLWVGVAIMALPILSGTRWVVLISPIFVVILLTRISGVPLLEKRGAKRWGDDPAYQRYLADTPSLILRPPR